MEKYRYYKDSGIEWVGEIPEHWKMISIKFLLVKGKEGIKIGPFGSALKLDKLVEDGLKVYGQENVIRNDFSLGRRYISQDYFNEMRQYKIVPNDLLITMMGTTGKSKIVPKGIRQGIMDSHLIRLRVDENLFFAKYLSLIIEESYSVGQNIFFLGKGSIMHGLNSSIIRAIKIPTPPIEEQTAIASFLDHKTRQIDDLIAKKERLIKLLKEERTAIINQAVTRGLEPDVPMKDSGIEWLGEIPEHWEVKKIKHVAFLKSGENIKSDVIKESGQYPVFGGNGLRGYCEKFTHEGYYVLIGRQGALCGNINFISGKFWASEHAVVVNVFADNSVIYIGKLMETMNLNQYSVSAAQPGLSVENIKNLWIVVPSKTEQNKIAEYLEEVESEYNLRDQLINREIDLLYEYKTAIINEAVTGKIKVHNGD